MKNTLRTVTRLSLIISFVTLASNANASSVFSEHFCTGLDLKQSDFFSLFQPGTTSAKGGFFSTQARTRSCAVFTGCSEWRQTSRPDIEVERSGLMYDFDHWGYYNIEFKHDERKHRLEYKVHFVGAPYTVDQTTKNSFQCRFSQSENELRLNPSCEYPNSLYVNKQRMNFSSADFKIKKKSNYRDDACVWLKLKSIDPVLGADQWNETEAVFYGEL